MKYTVDKQERFTLFALNEKTLNSTIAPDLKSELVILQNEGVQSLILDLSNVHYIDSSGLSSILTGHRIWKGDAAFLLTGLQPAVEKLIHVSQLHNILSIMPNIDDALAFIKEIDDEEAAAISDDK